MFKCSLWDVKEPKHYSKRAGNNVPGVVAVLCECMGGYREGDMPRMGLSPVRIGAKVAKTKTDGRTDG